MINIAHSSEFHPILVSEQKYAELLQRTKRGWSNCSEQEEWMVKLHYLRQGYKEGKIKKDDFFTRERILVISWWKRWC